LRQELDEMGARVKQVMTQTRARIFRGNMHRKAVKGGIMAASSLGTLSLSFADSTSQCIILAAGR
jgi:uncharacterized protein YgbK (DUF1537 family)